jgi:hypothetical protein
MDFVGRFLSSHFAANPIFVVGGSRSGTIVLLKAIGQHPLILSSPSENPFVMDVARLANELATADERDTYYYQRSLRLSQEQIFDSLRRLIFETSFGPHQGARHLLAQLVTERVNVFRKRYWCTKTFPSETTAQGIQALYPKTHFVWILRNGIDVVHSRTKFPEFRDLPFAEHCDHWRSSIQRFAFLRRSTAATVVHQEDLTENPEAVFRRIFSGIGVPYHVASTDFALNNHVHPLANLDTKKGVNVKEVLAQRRPAYESWSESQRLAFKEICGESMEVAGYAMPY